MTRRLYILSWLMLGAIALMYFFTLFQSFSGDKTAQLMPPAPTQKAGPQTTARSADPSLSQALERMRSEIDLLKGSLEAANKENAALKAHIKTLEKAFGPATSALPSEPEKPKPTAMRKEAEENAAPAPKVVTIVMNMPTDGFADEFPESPLPIAGQPPPKRTLFAVELASGLKQDKLDARWRELKRLHPKLLGTLQPRSIETKEGSSTGADTHKLVVGPFENAAAAARLCARLNAAGERCEGAIFAGKPVGSVAAR